MSQRTIQYVIDCQLQKTVHVDKILDMEESALHQDRIEITSRHKAGCDKFICKKCLGPVWPAIDKGRYFKHFKPIDTTCEWYTGDSKRLDDLNALRFKNTVESPLHKRLKNLIFDFTNRDDRFEWAKPDEKFIVDETTKERRKPDVYAKFKSHEVAIELQLSRTYLYDISGRADFYKRHRIDLLWVFRNFHGFREMAAAKDIYHSNYGNAFELDPDAEKASLERDKLILRVHWQGYHEISPNTFQFGWKSELIDLEQLSWGAGLNAVYYVIPDQVEALAIQGRNASWFSNFEMAWMERHEKSELWKYKASKRAWSKFEILLTHRNIISFEQADETGFDKVIDQIFALKNHHQHYGKQNSVASVNQNLEYRPIYTDVLVAAMKAYSHDDLLTTESVCKKIESNQFLKYEVDERCEASLKAVFQLLFPELSVHL